MTLQPIQPLHLLAGELTGASVGENKPSPIKPLYSLGDVLTILPKAKRSQCELLVRSGKVVPARPSAGIGRDRKYDGKNVFEFAIAGELIELGVVGERLDKFFRRVIVNILDPRNAPEAEFLVLLPNVDGPVPSWLLTAAELPDFLNGTTNSAYVLNVRGILWNLQGALLDFHQPDAKKAGGRRRKPGK